MAGVPAIYAETSKTRVDLQTVGVIVDQKKNESIGVMS